jgi:hypothetical protein
LNRFKLSRLKNHSRAGLQVYTPTGRVKSLPPA